MLILNINYLLLYNNVIYVLLKFNVRFHEQTFIECTDNDIRPKEPRTIRTFLLI